MWAFELNFPRDLSKLILAMAKKIFLPLSTPTETGIGDIWDIFQFFLQCAHVILTSLQRMEKDTTSFAANEPAACLGTFDDIVIQVVLGVIRKRVI
jgi:hypothetical protein